LGVFGHLKSHQSLGLWVLWGTLLFVLTGAFLYFQKLAWQRPDIDATPKPEVTRTSISAADRPWLSVDVVPNGPLTFEGDNVNLVVRFIVRNTGRSAANEATINSKVIAPKLGANRNMYEEAINRQKEICVKEIPTIMPRTVFPGDIYAADWTFDMGRNEIEPNAIEGTKIFGLFIVGCVNYRFGDEPTGYQTGFVREVHVFDPKTPGARYGLFLDEEVPADRLVFDVSTFGGDYAH
jgi:hypothetical protein